MAKIYETTTGLVIDVPIVDGAGQDVDLSSAISAALNVLPPGEADEVTWPVTIESPNILRHVVPEGAPLAPGTYRIQPHLVLSSGFNGPWGVVHLPVEYKQRR